MLAADTIALLVVTWAIRSKLVNADLVFVAGERDLIPL